MNYILVTLWIISAAILVLIPYSIALFYQRSFERKTYPYVFFISLLFYIASSIMYFLSMLFLANLLFAMGGVLLGVASFRLHQVMTWRGK